MIDLLYPWLWFAAVPPLTYVTVKLATYAFLKARWQFQRDHDCANPYPDQKNQMKEDSDAV